MSFHFKKEFEHPRPESRRLLHEISRKALNISTEASNCLDETDSDEVNKTLSRIIDHANQISDTAMFISKSLIQSFES